MSQDEKIKVEDLIVLGNACPDIISDYRITVCTAGYSPRRGLIRVYPVPPNSLMKRWNIVRIPLERNSRDTRKESWKIQGSRSDWENLSSKIELVDRITSQNDKLETLQALHARFGADCVSDLNARRESLGFIRPQILGFGFEDRQDRELNLQSTLDGGKAFLTIKNYPLRPYVRYRCSECKSKNPHKQQVIEWGVYEWLRKNAGQEERVWENLHFNEDGYQQSLLIGNMALHRTSFMVISIFRFKGTFQYLRSIDQFTNDVSVTGSAASFET